jgi:hypothetical protein
LCCACAALIEPRGKIQEGYRCPGKDGSCRSRVTKFMRIFV